jgi:hypothetical protein
MSDRLQTINDALAATGNGELNFEFDGSDEWRVADSAYRRAVGFLTSRHDWKFATTSVNLAAILPENPSRLFSVAYALPNDCLVIETAYFGGRVISEYEIVDNRLCCNHDQGVSVKYVRSPDPGQWPPHFREMVTMKVEEFILRGLNEDIPSARQRMMDVEGLLTEVRPLIDQQEPGKAVFRSRTRARRLGFRRVNRFERDGAP